MIRRASRPRAGITLTEILISIMIMGIGLVSLATLFPLGLMRLREASRNTRSAFLAASAADDVEARGLLDRSKFVSNWWYSPPYTAANAAYDPWVQDRPLSVTNGLDRRLDISGIPNLPPFPVAYDPLWRYATANPNTAVTTVGFPPLAAQTGINAQYEGRFGCGFVGGSGGATGFIRPNPTSVGSTIPSAHGLQRVTNFLDYSIPASNAFAANMQFFLYDNNTNDGAYIGDVFASPDDVVLQGEGESSTGPNTGNPLLPALYTEQNAFQGRQNDWSYTWMVTGRQAERHNINLIDGDIVVFHNRAFGTEPTPSPFSADTNTYPVPIGERVLEAVFGYGSAIPTNPGFARGADHTVLLRWPAVMPDPDIKVGSWIADVTYERVGATDLARYTAQPAPGPYPNQRCYWYQISRRSEPGPATAFSTDPEQTSGNKLYRQMIVTVRTPLRAKTLLSQSTGEPLFVNVALFMPAVVNVIPKVFNTR